MPTLLMSKAKILKFIDFIQMENWIFVIKSVTSSLQVNLFANDHHHYSTRFESMVFQKFPPIILQFMVQNHLQSQQQLLGTFSVSFIWYKSKIWGMTDNFLSFCTIFCPFTPLTTQKAKIFKKWKNSLEIS